MNIYKYRSIQVFLVGILFFVGCSSENRKSQRLKEETSTSFKVPENGTLLFDGKTLNGWKITSFGTEGVIDAYDGKIVINYGDGASGITWKNDFPKVNYMVNLEARKTVGNDFFCGMTFPVKDEFCSLIIGGWGGPVVGLSCIDGLDAGDNETQVLKHFDKDVWYKITLQVTNNKIIAWVDHEKLVDFTYTNRELSIRPEVDLSKPFGICTWITTAELRNIWVQEIN